MPCCREKRRFPWHQRSACTGLLRCARRSASAPLMQTIAEHFSSDWQGLTGEETIARLQHIETQFPDEFATLVTAVYAACYETFEITDVIRSLGHVYSDRPQPDGYALKPFDPENPLERPSHTRDTSARPKMCAHRTFGRSS